MIADYCNQYAVWKCKIGTNEYGEAEYAEPVSIKCRKEQKTRLILNSKGEQVLSDTRLYTVTPIKVDDLIDDRIVISVLDLPDLEGKIEGYEVSL
ncbi:MAG: hypothetical protein Q8920_04465 [Bacillota bacterium]|nr:hypothetical protein [Bacillota bacterium]